jgi:hypothetical protein
VRRSAVECCLQSCSLVVDGTSFRVRTYDLGNNSFSTAPPDNERAFRPVRRFSATAS